VGGGLALVLVHRNRRGCRDDVAAEIGIWNGRWDWRGHWCRCQMGGVRLDSGALAGESTT
jgi:hypothetical protein